MKGPLNAPCSCGAGCDCGCCEGTEPLTPRTIANRPGLDAIAYRIGTQSSFLETMKARLSSKDFSELTGLTTRDGNDPSIALLDAWAVVADVLTFYQERIANEGYLRTATERRSVLELARLVGYAPRPGVAASAYLAYTLEEKFKPAISPTSPVTPVSTSPDQPEVVIPAGTRAQSIPGPGEMPQYFETSEDLTARAAWNKLQVRLTKPQTRERFEQTGSLYFKGTATQLKANDPLLIDPETDLASRLYRVLEVQPDVLNDRTRVTVEPWIKVPRERLIPRAPLRKKLAQLSDLQRQGIVSRVTARKVVETLASLNKAIDEDDPEPALQNKTRETLAILSQMRMEAGPNATLVNPWILKIEETLEEALSGQEEERRAASLAVMETTDISKVLDSLGRQPKPQPRNRLRLERDAGTLFETGSDLSARLLTVARPELRAGLYTAWANVPVALPPPVRVYALRARASVFGHNAPKERHLENGNMTEPEEWKLVRFSHAIMGDESPKGIVVPTEEKDVVWLDAPYPQIRPEQWTVLERLAANDDIPKLLIKKIEKTGEQSRAEYGVSAKVTRIELEGDWLKLDGEKPDDFSVLRSTAVFAQSEELTLAEEPITDSIYDQEIELVDLYDGLEPGRWLIVTGERTDVGKLDSEENVAVPVPGVPAAELVMLAGVRQDVRWIDLGPKANRKEPQAGERTHTFLTLAQPLAYSYMRETVTIYGNVAHATHGETRAEVMGSGDAAKALQSFTLKQPPLTWISAPTPSGIDSTLTVRVNGMRWHLAGSLAEMGPTDRSYILRTDDGGQTTVVFGNGERGARLPTGAENVRGTYRSGLGKEGNVQAGQISQLVSRPLGVRDVINPLPATGGADRESRDQARRNAPLAVLALDRLISVQDYEDFTRTFAGVGKAKAERIPEGGAQVIHITIAGEDDIPIGADSDLLKNLAAALGRFGDSRQPLRLAPCTRSFLVVQAEVKVLPDYFWDAVEPKIRAALLEAFGFQRRDLGQDAYLSEVYRVIQGVTGVDSIDVNLFETVDPEKLESLANIAGRTGDPQYQPPWRLQALGQLLYLTPEVADTLILKEPKS